MNDFNSGFSLVLGVIFGLVVISYVAFIVLREVLLNRDITRTQVTTPAEREAAALALEAERMVHGQVTRLYEPIPEVEPAPLVINLDALEA